MEKTVRKERGNRIRKGKRYERKKEKKRTNKGKIKKENVGFSAAVFCCSHFGHAVVELI